MSHYVYNVYFQRVHYVYNAGEFSFEIFHHYPLDLKCVLRRLILCSPDLSAESVVRLGRNYSQGMHKWQGSCGGAIGKMTGLKGIRRHPAQGGSCPLLRTAPHREGQ